MSYIDIIHEHDAQGELAALYKRYAGADGRVDNVLKVHSLNPESLGAHCALYVQACHRPSPVSRVEREIVGVVVSHINDCGYCRTHHAAGLRRLLPDDRAHLGDEVAGGELSNLTARERAMAEYAAKLTSEPGSVGQGDIDALRAAGLGDREILDVAQVAAYFAYANRIVLGLGAALEPGQGEPGRAPGSGG